MDVMLLEGVLIVVTLRKEPLRRHNAQEDGRGTYCGHGGHKACHALLQALCT